MAFTESKGTSAYSEMGRSARRSGVAEFDGYDVLQKFCDGLGSGYVAGHGEEFGMAGEELAPVGGGLFVPAGINSSVVRTGWFMVAPDVKRGGRCRGGIASPSKEIFASWA